MSTYRRTISYIKTLGIPAGLVHIHGMCLWILGGLREMRHSLQVCLKSSRLVPVIVPQSSGENYEDVKMTGLAG